MTRLESLLQQCGQELVLSRCAGECNLDLAIRLFRQYWNGEESWLYVLSAASGREMIELITLGQGTLWITDEPDPALEKPLEERKELFLQRLLGSQYRTQTLAA